jgi:hypothetical protein
VYEPVAIRAGRELLGVRRTGNNAGSGSGSGPWICYRRLTGHPDVQVADSDFGPPGPQARQSEAIGPPLSRRVYLSGRALTTTRDLLSATEKIFRLKRASHSLSLNPTSARS